MTAPHERIEHARTRLAANLGELQQRLNRARRLVSPRTYLSSPWLKLGLGIAAGYFVGSRHAQRRLPSGDEPAPAAPGLLHTMLRTAVLSAAGALIESAVARLIKGAASTDELESPSDRAVLPSADP